MANRIFIVTGANTGIGYEIVRLLVSHDEGIQVVMVCRNESRGSAALNQIKNDCPRANIELVVGDLGTTASATATAEVLRAQFPKIHCLIHNAGLWPTELKLNEDGFEQAFAVNHLASFILTHILQDSVEDRIVFVSGGLYTKGKFNIEKTPWGTDFGRISTYCNTKQASVLLFLLWNERLREKGVRVLMGHPGVANTQLGDGTGIARCLLRTIKMLWKTPHEVAKQVVWWATSDEPLPGVYYNEKEPMALTENVKDADLTRQLWEKSLVWSEVTKKPPSK